MIEAQPSRLLPSLFDHVEEGSRLTVLNIGPALPETIDFFSNYRCKLHIADLLQEAVPDIDADLEESERMAQWRTFLDAALVLPDGVRFDLLFFWDVLNFLHRDAIAALMEVLGDHVHARSKAHCFAVHSADAAPAPVFYGIRDAEHLSRRPRSQIPPNYQPLPQNQLVGLLRYFRTDRSVLMNDRRVELLLKAEIPPGA